jgi:hypothetical protein
MKLFKSFFEEMAAALAERKQAAADFRRIYTPRALQVFELADDGVAARVLKGFGLNTSQVRQEVLKKVAPKFLAGGERSAS